jgi:hypothetical protein
MTIDASGNLYIADQNNHSIRKINTSGIISSIAGNGIWGFTGDGGPATAAQLNLPSDVAFDGLGNLYITDNANGRIRMINTSGIINTVAGNGTSGYTGDGGQATSAQFNGIYGITLDASGNIYVADAGNFCVRMINTSGIINTVAGNGTSGFSGDGGQATAAQLRNARGVAIDATGNLYIADGVNNCIRMVNSAGIINTVVGNGTAAYSGDGGQATAAELNTPMDLIFDATGNMYIADAHNNCIRVVNTSGIITTIAGNGSQGFSGDGGQATAATFHSTDDVVLDGVGNIYITDYFNQRIRQVNVPLTVSVNSATLCAGSTATLSASGATTYSWTPVTNLNTTTSASVIASPTSTTVYTVTGIGAFGTSTTTSTSTVTINPLPTLTITSTAGYSLCPNTPDTLKASGTATSYTWSPGTHVVTNYTVHPNNSTTYTLTGVDANGCKNKITQLITVYPRPTLTITPSVAPICAGDTTTLSIVTGSISVTSYSWSTSATTSSISVSPIITTTYAVTGFDAMGCTGRTHYTLTVNSLPIVTANSDSAGTICQGSPVVLTAAGATTYTWNNSATTTTVAITPTITTTYTVMGTDGNGCENMATVTQSVSTSCISGIEQHNNSNNITIYPNPSNGNFSVETLEAAPQILQIFDLTGRLVITKTITGNTNINGTDLVDGIYNVKITNNGTVINKRIIVSK